MDESIDTKQVELMLAGWSQTHNGGAKVTFWLTEEDLAAFKDATVKKGNHAGQRYMAVFVEIGPDERPVRHPIGNLAFSAVRLCKTPTFQQFCREINEVDSTLGDEECAKRTILQRCGVTSRKDIDGEPRAREEFRRLMATYRDFLAENGYEVDA